MKVGLLSDIHGNADALLAVLSAARREMVESLIIAGDFVGYYYAIDRVLEILQGWPFSAVRGNHEDMLQAWLSGGDRAAIKGKYGSALEEAVRRLPRESIEWLLALPRNRAVVVDGKRCYICHGSPRATDEYIYPDALKEKSDILFEQNADLVVFGHTHRPLIWSRSGTIVVNPGSVGQPRDYQPGACWALWDTASHSVELRRESYDMQPVLAEAMARDPELDYLVNVLTRVK